MIRSPIMGSARFMKEPLVVQSLNLKIYVNCAFYDTSMKFGTGTQFDTLRKSDKLICKSNSASVRKREEFTAAPDRNIRNGRKIEAKFHHLKTSKSIQCQITVHNKFNYHASKVKAAFISVVWKKHIENYLLSNSNSNSFQDSQKDPEVQTKTL